MGVDGTEVLGDRCNALRPIFGDRTGDPFMLKCMAGGDDGEDIVGDAGGKICLLVEGEAGGVLDSFGDEDRGILFLDCCCRGGILVPGPELSEGVGGSPLLQAIEQ